MIFTSLTHITELLLVPVFVMAICAATLMSVDLLSITSHPFPIFPSPVPVLRQRMGLVYETEILQPLSRGLNSFPVKEKSFNCRAIRMETCSMELSSLLVRWELLQKLLSTSFQAFP